MNILKYSCLGWKIKNSPICITVSLSWVKKSPLHKPLWVVVFFSEANLRDMLRKKNLTPIKRKTLNKIWHTKTIHMKTHWKNKWIAGRYNQRLFNEKGTWASAGSSRGIICQLEPIYCYQLNNSRSIVWVNASYSQQLLR